ncbi:hypothetical protein DL771_006706 [Monosporascus sp. 5C6A]|nr:hypothetical protein DL771_006706 [Monosporascus sp. 5C6A]
MTPALILATVISVASALMLHRAAVVVRGAAVLPTRGRYSECDNNQQKLANIGDENDALSTSARLPIADVRGRPDACKAGGAGGGGGGARGGGGAGARPPRLGRLRKLRREGKAETDVLTKAQAERLAERTAKRTAETEADHHIYGRDHPAISVTIVAAVVADVVGCRR